MRVLLRLLPVYHQVGLLESCVLLQGAPWNHAMPAAECAAVSAMPATCKVKQFSQIDRCGNVYLVNEVEYDMALDSDPQMWHCDPQMWVPSLNTEFLFDFFDRSCCN